jgi:hypothetical protein
MIKYIDIGKLQNMEYPRAVMGPLLLLLYITDLATIRMTLWQDIALFSIP